MDVCYRGLQLDQSNASLKKLMEQIKSRAEIKEKQDRQRRAEEQRKQKEKTLLKAALAARNIKIRGSEKPPDLQDAVIRLSPDPLSPTSLLVFPVMFLYPMHNQSDLIKAFAEKDAIIDHLSYMIPLPWDGKAEYTLNNVECYMDTSAGGMIKIGKKLSLLESLSNGKTEVVDGLVRIYVVPSALSAKWVEEVKRKRGR